MSANTQSKSAEPSMEEILASIRRIISDDQAPADQPEPELPPAIKPAASAAVAKPVPQARTPEPEPPDVQPDDSVDVDPIEAEDAQLSDADDFDDDVLELVDPVRPIMAIQPPPPVAKMPDAPPPSAARQTQPFQKDEHLLSSSTDAVVANAFSALSHPSPDLGATGGTLDEMFRNMLRPMLKTWLDENLPAIVERLVRAEIERVARYGR